MIERFLGIVQQDKAEFTLSKEHLACKGFAKITNQMAFSDDFVSFIYFLPKRNCDEISR